MDDVLYNLIITIIFIAIIWLPFSWLISSIKDLNKKLTALEKRIDEENLVQNKRIYKLQKLIEDKEKSFK